MLQFATPDHDKPKPEFKQRNWEEITAGAKGWMPSSGWFFGGGVFLIGSCFFSGWAEALWIMASLALFSRYAAEWIRYHLWLTAQVFDENRWRQDWKDTFEGRVHRSDTLCKHAEEWLKHIQIMRNCNDNSVKK